MSASVSGAIVGGLAFSAKTYRECDFDGVARAFYLSRPLRELDGFALESADVAQACNSSFDLRTKQHLLHWPFIHSCYRKLPRSFVSEAQLCEFISTTCKSLRLSEGNLLHAFHGFVGSRPFAAIVGHHAVLDAYSVLLLLRRFGEERLSPLPIPTWRDWRDTLLDILSDSATSTLLLDSFVRRWTRTFQVKGDSRIGFLRYGSFKHTALSVECGRGSALSELQARFDCFFGPLCSSIFVAALIPAWREEGAYYPFWYACSGRQEHREWFRFGRSVGYFSFPTMVLTPTLRGTPVLEFIRSSLCSIDYYLRCAPAFCAAHHSDWPSTSFAIDETRTLRSPELYINFYGQLSGHPGPPFAEEIALSNIRSENNGRNYSLEVVMGIREQRLDVEIAYDATIWSDSEIDQIANRFPETILQLSRSI